MICNNYLIYYYHFNVTAITCPPGMVYQQCGPVCPQTCDTDENVDCSGGCVEGCFCPSGEVVLNGNCVNRSDCQGKYDVCICLYIYHG